MWVGHWLGSLGSALAISSVVGEWVARQLVAGDPVCVSLVRLGLSEGGGVCLTCSLPCRLPPGISLPRLSRVLGLCARAIQAPLTPHCASYTVRLSWLGKHTLRFARGFPGIRVRPTRFPLSPSPPGTPSPERPCVQWPGLWAMQGLPTPRCASYVVRLSWREKPTPPHRSPRLSFVFSAPLCPQRPSIPSAPSPAVTVLPAI